MRASLSRYINSSKTIVIGLVENYGKWEYFGAIFKNNAIESESEFPSKIDLLDWVKNYKFLPAVICIETKKVLTKSFNKKVDSREILRSLTPNANHQDFLVQYCEVGDFLHASIVRKRVIENALEGLEKSTNVVQIYLSPLVKISYVLDNYSNTTIVGAHEFVINDNNLIEINTISSTTQEMTNLLEEKEIIARSAINSRKMKFTSDFNSNLAEREYLYKVLLLKLLKIPLFTLGLLLLGSSIFLVIKQSENAKLEKEYKRFIQLKNKVALYSNTLSSKVDSTNQNADYVFSRIVQVVGKSIPQEINLTNLNIQIVDKKKTSIDDQKLVEIEGIAYSKEVFFMWNAMLEKIMTNGTLIESQFNWNDKAESGLFNVKIELNGVPG